MTLEEPGGPLETVMSGTTALRTADPVDGLRTVHLIEDAIVQRGLRQLRGLLRDAEGRRLLDEMTVGAVASLHELDEIIGEWGGRPESLFAPVADRAELLRSFVDLKESEALVLRRAAREAPAALRGRLERLADQAEDHARRLAAVSD